MRDIKFRVWDKAENKWFPLKNCPAFLLNNDQKENLVFITKDGPYPIPQTGQDSGGRNRLVVQQFTGLKDKYGKEIYEGDLIQYNRQSSYDGTNFEVKWSEDRWGWVLVSENGDFLGNEYTPEGDRYKFIEIVGNIFENSQLLS